MKGKQMIILAAIVLLATTLSVKKGRAKVEEASAPTQSTTCNSCEDCTDKLISGDYHTVTLTTNINNIEGGCITLIEKSNLVFDCDGHTIDGDDVYLDEEFGIRMAGGTGNTIQNCTITDFDRGIGLHNTTNHEIANNTITSNDSGVYLAGVASLTNVHDNTIDDNRIGIYLSNADDSTINSNVVCDNTFSDFIVESGSGNSGDNNTCNHPDGWNDQGADGCTSRCEGTATCSSCTECSGMLDGTSDTVILDANISNHVGDCIVFGADGDNVVFDCDGYTIDGDGSGTDVGISMSGGMGNTVRNCTVRDFSYGILLSHSSEVNLIERNTINSNTWGIYLNDSPGNTIRDNVVHSNTDGIMLSSSLSYGNTVSGNEVSSNSRGICVNFANANTISANDVFDNDSSDAWGIIVYGSEANVVSGNDVTGNWGGISIGNSRNNDFRYNTVCSDSSYDFFLEDQYSLDNQGDLNTCDEAIGWSDDGKSSGCTYRCSLCTDGVQNGDEEGVDCGGTYCPPCAQCTDEPTTKWAPHDTPCNDDWPTNDGPHIGMNTRDDSCNLIEVCNPDLDYIVEDALLCCEQEVYTNTFSSGSRFLAKSAACEYAHTQAYNGDFQDEFNETSIKQCLAHYIIQGLGANAVYMQGYFYGELCCHHSDSCPASCSYWEVEPPAWDMGTDYSCNGPGGETPDFQMGNHRCEYGTLFRIKIPKPGYWDSDTDYTLNSDSFADVPPHASINRLSTGTCVDYSFALTTLLRKAGYSKDDILSVGGVGHTYNLLRFPGESKWHYVDTVGNTGGGVYGGPGFENPSDLCCKGTPTSCSELTEQGPCESTGCTWSGGACSGTPEEGSCGRAFSDKMGCRRTDGCSWRTCTYDYCRKMDEGCTNDVYRTWKRNCPSNDSIYGCEGIEQALSVVALSPMPEPESAPGYPYVLDPNGVDQDCTELNPCVGESIGEVRPPGPMHLIAVIKTLSSDEITLGESLEVSVRVSHADRESLDMVVQENFVPGITYNLETQERAYEGFSSQYHNWSLQVARGEKKVLTFTVTPHSLGYHTFNPTIVFAGDVNRSSSSPSVKVVCDPNGTCDPGETAVFCPQDCQTGIQDDYCDMAEDGRIDPDCPYEVDPDYDPRADTDGDGVTDNGDNCPLTPIGATVDEDGCACSQKICPEGDEDTISYCNPTTAECEYLPDDDEDDVPNDADNCPTTYNPEQYDCNGNGTGDQCEIGPVASDTTLENGTYCIDDSGLDGAVVITASNVSLDCNGATILGTGGGYGIYVPDSLQGVTVRNCTVRNYRYGIYLDNSNSHNLISNTLSMNGYGILLGSSSGNLIRNNVTISNTFAGLYLEDSDVNDIFYNTVNGNSRAGILLHTSQKNNIYGNIVCDNTNADFEIYELDNSGDANTCDNPGDWNDHETTGCSFACKGSGYTIYLPLVLKNL
jgi:parallel beta-helix repeat protein